MKPLSLLCAPSRKPWMSGMARTSLSLQVALGVVVARFLVRANSVSSVPIQFSQAGAARQIGLVALLLLAVIVWRTHSMSRPSGWIFARASWRLRLANSFIVVVFTWCPYLAARPSCKVSVSPST